MRLSLGCTHIILACALHGTTCMATDADQTACLASYNTYRAGHSDLIENCPLGSGTEGEYRSKCPPGMQRLIDAAYADCGGLVVDWQEVGGIDWDSEIGGRIKNDVEKCGCSRGTTTLPTVATLLFMSWLLT